MVEIQYTTIVVESYDCQDQGMRKFSEDYEIIVNQNENGKETKTVRYKGKYYEVLLDEAGIIRFRKNSLLLLAAIIILHITSGFLGNQGMYQFYVALPYVLAFFPLIYLSAGLLRLPKEKRNYQRDEIEFSYYRIKTASIFLAILLGIEVIGEIAFLLFANATQSYEMDFSFLLIEILIFIGSLLLFNLQKQVQIKPLNEI